jgi:hypothetical protein
LRVPGDRGTFNARDAGRNYQVPFSQSGARPASESNNEEHWIRYLFDGPFRRFLRTDVTNTADYSRKLRAGFSVIELAGERLKSVRTWDFACIPGSQDARNFFSKGGKYQQHPMHRSGMLRTAQGERPGRNAPAGG